MPNQKARIIAFYLPQYHPIPENDQWWGKGFTEWTNVTNAKPLFPGHQQPKLPSELGFYDLRVPEVREAQAELAYEHGIEGFCYWHYWLGGGKQLLEYPFSEVLKSGKPDFPFCLGWANHSWTGTWFGAGKNILVEQSYPGIQDHIEHFNWLLKAFSDPRYMKIDGKPIFYIHLPLSIPDVQAVLDLWREMALKVGFSGLFIIGENLSLDQVHSLGFDGCSYGYQRRIQSRAIRPKYIRPFYSLKLNMLANLRLPEVYSYKKAMKYFLKDGIAPLVEFPAIIPGWDTTPRFGQYALVYIRNTPKLFLQHIRDATDRIKYKPHEYRVLFLKSWNEWAEGNYIEPDQINGRAFLEVIREANCK